MPEIGTSGLMSGDGKRSDGQRPQATAPILDSTTAVILGQPLRLANWVASGRSPHPSGDVPRAAANVVFQPKSMAALSGRRGERLQPPRPPSCLALGIYERHGDGAAHQHNDPAH